MCTLKSLVLEVVQITLYKDLNFVTNKTDLHSFPYCQKIPSSFMDGKKFQKDLQNIAT